MVEIQPTDKSLKFKFDWKNEQKILGMAKKTYQSFNILIDHDEAWACSFIFLLSHGSDSLSIFLYAIICFKSVKKCDFCPGQDSTFPRINSSNQ